MVFACDSSCNIVIKRSALEKVKSGLSYEFIDEYQVEEGYFDDSLIIIRAGSEGAALDIIDNLETKYNLVHLRNGVAQDMVCVQNGDCCSKCGWLKSGTLKEEMFVGDEVFPEDYPFYEIVE